MKQLSGDVKLFIVTRLAMYETPSQVVEAVKGEFGRDITREHVRTYNPDQCEVPAKWKVEFELARTRFRERIENIPIANRAVRLKWLNSVAVSAMTRGNAAIVLAATRQAAEEIGEVYTNRQRMTFTDPSGEKAGALVVEVSTTCSKCGSHGEPETNHSATTRAA